MSQTRIKPKRYPGTVKLGATGAHPEGKICPNDEGEIRLAVGCDLAHGVVVLDFGQPVAWIGFPPKKARELAAMLNTRADECEQRGIQ